MSSPAPSTCPGCGSPATGHFCANCGTPLAGALCAGCGSALTEGAKFCHRCGTAVGSGAGAAAALPLAAGGRRGGGAAAGAAGRVTGDWLPWGVAAIALLTVVALVAGQNFRAQRGGSLDGPSNAFPQAGLDDRSGAGAATAAAGGGAPLAAPEGGPGAPPAGRAPDISSLSPEERAARLFDRVMRYDEQGKRDSLQIFAPMAIVAYEMIGTLDTDQRYDLGRIGEASGNYLVAKAQADTILRAQPNHLLALALAARMSPDPAVARQFQQRLLAAAPAELQKKLPEYQRHRADITAALTQARGAK
jgi:hypothetical protein